MSNINDVILETKKSYKKIKIDVKEIEHIVAFNPPESKKTLW